ncbi:MAG: type II secretion system F family protein [Acidimicrobiales bacterium]
MILVAYVTAAMACLVLVAPWRQPSRSLRPTATVVARPARFAAAGPWWGAGVAGSALLVHPLVALVVLAWPSWRRWSTSRSRHTARHDQALRSLPETADLVGLGIGAGLSVRDSVSHAARWADDPYAGVFAEALRRAEAGETFARALDAAAGDLDPVAQPLVALLAAADTDGGAVGTALTRLGDDARRRRRSGAAARARRLPVTMLLPLVLCVLPAFGLVAVAPLVLSALGSLEIGF